MLVGVCLNFGQSRLAASPIPVFKLSYANLILTPALYLTHRHEADIHLNISFATYLWKELQVFSKNSELFLSTIKGLHTVFVQSLCILIKTQCVVSCPWLCSYGLRFCSAYLGRILPFMKVITVKREGHTTMERWSEKLSVTSFYI